MRYFFIVLSIFLLMGSQIHAAQCFDVMSRAHKSFDVFAQECVKSQGKCLDGITHIMTDKGGVAEIMSLAITPDNKIRCLADLSMWSNAYVGAMRACGLHRDCQKINDMKPVYVDDLETSGSALWERRKRARMSKEKES